MTLQLWECCKVVLVMCVFCVEWEGGLRLALLSYSNLSLLCHSWYFMFYEHTLHYFSNKDFALGTVLILWKAVDSLCMFAAIKCPLSGSASEY